jgi:hypothetical protein
VIGLAALAFFALWTLGLLEMKPTKQPAPRPRSLLAEFLAAIPFTVEEP